MEKQPGSLKILWFFFGQYKLQVLLMVTLSIIVGGLEAAGVAVVYPILSAAFQDGFVRENFVLSLFSTLASLLPVADEFVAYCLLFLILAVLIFAVKLVFITYRLAFAARIVVKSHNDIFYKFIQADYQYFMDHKQGELTYNAITAPHSLQTLVTSGAELGAQTILSVSVIILLFSLSWQGTVAVLLMGLMYYLFTRYLAERVAYDAAKRQAQALTESLIVLNEVFSGIKQVKVFAIAEDWLRKFRDTISRHWYHYVRRSAWQQALNPLLILILYLFIGIIALIIRVLAPNSFTDLIPVFGTFAFAVYRLVPIMGGITNATMDIRSSLPNCERIYNILREKLTNIEDGGQELKSFQSGIEFDNVSFGYPEREKVLENISATFEKGKTTAIVGQSGAGKTTIINLLLRLFDVNQGEVKIDGVDIRQYKWVSWLDKIGYVGQETFIFNDTIRNNITLGPKYSYEEVVKASKYADAYSFIVEMPDGYDTLVGDKGMKLSGGQKQRIAVARAMIRNPQILIFDEATNALDSISEAAVQKAINNLARDHTVIIIAHRLSTVVNADKIIVLGDRRVLEKGTHKELMAKGGAYYNLYTPESER